MMIPSGLSRDEINAYDTLLCRTLGIARLPGLLFDRLTRTERVILEATRRAYPQPLPHATLQLLLNDNWLSAQKVSSHTIQTHLYRLRRTLRHLGVPMQVTTIRGIDRVSGGGGAYLLVLSETPALEVAA